MDYTVISLSKKIKMLVEVIKEEEIEIGNKALRKKRKRTLFELCRIFFFCGNNSEMTEF